jgi:hypothetical protein
VLNVHPTATFQRDSAPAPRPATLQTNNGQSRNIRDDRGPYSIRGPRGRDSCSELMTINCSVLGHEGSRDCPAVCMQLHPDCWAPVRPIFGSDHPMSHLTENSVGGQVSGGRYGFEPRVQQFGATRRPNATVKDARCGIVTSASQDGECSKWAPYSLHFMYVRTVQQLDQNSSWLRDLTRCSATWHGENNNSKRLHAQGQVKFQPHNTFLVMQD